MWEKLLLWFGEKIIAGIWHRIFKPKSAEAIERHEANEIQKPANDPWPTIVDKL